MVLKKLQGFIDKLEEQRIKKEGGKGTIWCSLKDFETVADYFEGNMLSPGGAAGMLKVSRAMIHQLEKDGKIRAYRIIEDEKGWEHESWYIKLLMSKKGQQIWIPVEDLLKYAEKTGKADYPAVQYETKRIKDREKQTKEEHGKSRGKTK